MSKVIARRFSQLYGDVNESVYEENRYFVGGKDVNEELRQLQQNVFAFVADEDRVAEVVLTVKAGPEDVMEMGEVSGFAKFVLVPAENSELKKQRSKMHEFNATFTGKVMEMGRGQFYCVTEMGEEQNMTAAFTRLLPRALDNFAATREAVTVFMELTATDASAE